MPPRLSQQEGRPGSGGQTAPWDQVSSLLFKACLLVPGSGRGGRRLRDQDEKLQSRLGPACLWQLASWPWRLISRLPAGRGLSRQGRCSLQRPWAGDRDQALSQLRRGHLALQQRPSQAQNAQVPTATVIHSQLTVTHVGTWPHAHTPKPSHFVPQSTGTESRCS